MESVQPSHSRSGPDVSDPAFLPESSGRLQPDVAGVGVGPLERGHEASDRPATAVRVLLVEEDNVVNQRVAIALLERRGHHVTLARNGLEALNVLERNQFDLVLMDLHMPVMGGLEATAEIRTRDRRHWDPYANCGDDGRRYGRRPRVVPASWHG